MVGMSGKRFTSNKQWIAAGTIVDICDNGKVIMQVFDNDNIQDVVDLLNNQEDEIQQLKEKLQVSDGSLALLIDMILLGDVDELIKRTRECARQVAEQFDKFTKEEFEDAVKGNARLRELCDDEREKI